MNFRAHAKARREPQLEITPLIDVVFLLLIFFLLTTSFVRQQSLAIDLPATQGASAEAAANALLLVLTRDGRLHYQGAFLDEPGLDALLKQHQTLAQSGRAKPVRLQADADVPHGRVVQLLDRLRRGGVAHLGVVTRASGSSQGGPRSDPTVRE